MATTVPAILNAFRMRSVLESGDSESRKSSLPVSNRPLVITSDMLRQQSLGSTVPGRSAPTAPLCSAAIRLYLAVGVVRSPGAFARGSFPRPHQNGASGMNWAGFEPATLGHLLRRGPCSARCCPRLGPHLFPGLGDSTNARQDVPVSASLGNQRMDHEGLEPSTAPLSVGCSAAELTVRLRPYLGFRCQALTSISRGVVLPRAIL